jgi:hypothetical protein
MAQLSSPGVSVTVIDESFYTPAAPGTTPLIIVASAENKENGSGTGTAPGTLASNAGKVYLLTSQKDLADTFGTPVFKTDASNNPVHAGEQNEYGLQAAYSYLGVSNRVFAVRADIDLGELDAAAAAPSGDPVNGTWWVDVASSLFGIFEWNSASISNGGQKFVNKVPLVITDTAKLSNGAPKNSIGAKGSYALVATSTLMTLYYKDAVGEWVEVGSPEWLGGFDGTPSIAIGPHTSVPQWKSTAEDAITGSVWIKTTDPNLGAKWRVKRWNSLADTWETIAAPIYSTSAAALKGLDSSGGGANLSTNSIYIKSNDSEATDLITNFKVYKRKAVGATTVTSKIVSNSNSTTTVVLSAITNTFEMQETLAGQSAFGPLLEVEIALNGNAGDADLIAEAINAKGFVNIVADVSPTNQLIITHKLGGEIKFINGTGTPLTKLFTAYNIVDGTGTANYYAKPADATGYDFVATLWERLSAVISVDAPSLTPPDGRLWYSSVVDEIDILVHNGEAWVGLQYDGSSGISNIPSPFFDLTDFNGPIISATAPTTNSSGTALVDGDLWISTADIENFPMIYKRVNSKWTLLDNADQTTEDGVLFRDARYGATGGTWDPVTLTGTAPDSTIAELLASDYLDPDAPDPALYPQGMLLWNLRRSGFNVKQFKENYIDQNAENTRYGDAIMTTYYPHRWVSVAANQENGAGTFGRHAQRKVVVQALQALVNANQQIRDEESRVFNLIACPGYPELIGEMINLNYDRGLTAFVVGDSPARLASDATSLLAWGTNQALALEDNDDGLVSSDEYLGIFYPWGFTSDNLGNNVVVPPSHMMLRTIALSDNVAYPWFAPAGTRRGGITNATAVGYVDALTGEFQSVALNTGQRDTLASVKVNPLTFITGTGLVNYGQYTRARNASSLDRINVARLVIYLRRQLSILAKPYIFEPNDTITRNEIRQAAESLMLELVGQRALYDYLVVCDTSNNTPSRIDRNELYLDIAIEPVKAVEFIYIPLRLKNTGEIAGLG